MPAVIEFRSGAYFQSLIADRGGSLDTARVFDDKAAARTFMDANEWIYWNGGTAVEVQLVAKLVPVRTS